MSYSIWIEFEHYVDNPLTDEDGYCNIEVIYDDGRVEGYEVCTVDYFKDNIQRILQQVEKDGFSTPPDIIVTRLERDHITEVLKQILVQEAADEISS